LSNFQVMSLKKQITNNHITYIFIIVLHIIFLERKDNLTKLIPFNDCMIFLFKNIA